MLSGMSILLPFFLSVAFAHLVMALWLVAFSLSFWRAAAVGFMAGMLMFWMLTA